MSNNPNSDIKQQFISFLWKLTLVIAFIVLMYVAVIYLFPDMDVPSKAVSIFIILYAITAALHYYLLKVSKGKVSKLVGLIILSSVVKLFLYAIFTFLLIIADPSGAMANVVLFFLAYIILTIFEITTIHRQINHPHSKQNSN